MEIYGIHLGGIPDWTRYLRLQEILPAEKKAKISRYLRVEDAMRSLVADVLARMLVLEKTGIGYASMEILKNFYGKPYLGNDPGFHFNVSHSGDWVFCAIGEAPLGIDVERIKETDLRIAERFFAPSEYRELKMVAGPERLRYFFDLWTLKESFIKATGKGLSEGLDTFSVRVKGGRVEFERKDGTKDAVYFTRYNVSRDYKLAVCTFHPDPPAKYEMMDLERFLLRFERTLHS